MSLLVEKVKKAAEDGYITPEEADVIENEFPSASLKETEDAFELLNREKPYFFHASHRIRIGDSFFREYIEKGKQPIKNFEPHPVLDKIDKRLRDMQNALAPEGISEKSTLEKQGGTVPPELNRRWIRGIDSNAVVPQEFYGTLQALDSRFLRTDGLTICVGLVLYDPATKTGGIVHFAVGALVSVEQTVSDIITDLKKRGVETKNLKAYIVGGKRDLSEAAYVDIRNALDHYRIPVEGEDIFGNWYRDVALDLQTGDLYIRALSL